MSALAATAVAERPLSWGHPDVQEQALAVDHAPRIDLAVDIETALTVLTDVERSVIVGYFGLGGRPPVDLRELAAALCVTVPQLSAIRLEAQQKLAGHLRGLR